MTFVNAVPADGFDFTCSIASCSLKLTGFVLPVDPLEMFDGLELEAPLLMASPPAPPSVAPVTVAVTVPQFP